MAKQKFSSKNNDITAGVILLIIGGLLFLKAVGIWFPVWVFSWPMILIAIGVVSLVKNNYDSGFGVVMVILGGFFLVKRNFGFPIELEPYLIPMGLMILGIYLIIKRKNRDRGFDENFFKRFEKNTGTSSSVTDEANEMLGVTSDHGDYVNAQALFTGINRRILSKNFKGGKTSAIFGGTQIDLTQADLAEGASLNVEVAFGGVELIIPAHWELQINVSNVFAGVEDKRMYPQTPTDPTKVLKIYGSVIFGGLEIKSF